MGLGVVMVNVRQIFTRNIQQVRMIVIADREDDVASVTDPPDSARRLRFNGKERPSGRLVWLRAYTYDSFFENNPKIESVHHLSVVLQRLCTRWFVERRDERNAANLQKLRCGEKHHLRREVINRVDQRPLFEDLVVQSA